MVEQPSEKETPTTPKDDHTDEKDDKQTTAAQEMRQSDEESTVSQRVRDRIDSDGVDRRKFLGVGLGAAALAGFGSSNALSAQTTTVDIVEAGADPTGQEPIDSVLESVVEDNTIVEFQSDGEFAISGASLSADNFELRGNGAKLLPSGGFIQCNGYGWVMDGFEIDMRPSDDYPSAFFEGGDYTVSRCVWRGQAGTADSYAVFTKFESGTTAHFVDCYWPDGAVDGGVESNFGCIGSFLNNTNGGHLKFERCWWHGWSEDTLYLSEVSGTVEVVDCYLVNTIVGPRVSNVTLRRVKSVHTEDIPIEKWSGSSFQRGAWLNGEKGVEGDVLIDDCDFYIDGPDGGGGVKGDHMPGPVTIQNTRIHQTSSSPAIWLGTDDSNDITLSNVELSGNDEVILDGNILENDVTTVSKSAADPSPHIPLPPDDGSIPAQDTSDGTDDGTNGGSGTTWYELVVEGVKDDVSMYSVVVSDSIEKHDTIGTQNKSDVISGTEVSGYVHDDVDGYRFSGRLERVELTGSATISVTPE